jgi:dTDP-4-amino-4,6-dideoxygalactose transaminase
MSNSQPKDDESFVVFGQPQILDDEIAEVIACLRSGWIGTGPRVTQFEKDFAAFKGVANAAAVGSCSAALQLSLLAAGIQPGDDVITSALTFCGTINSIIHAGGVPVLADIDPLSMNLDPGDVEARITPRTRALIPVHFAGRPCDMDALTAIASRNNLRVIEDCAHATDAEYHGKPVGGFGNFGCFSFYVTKNVTTAEGGMVIAQEDKDLCEVRMLSLHGLDLDAWHRFGQNGYKHYHALRVGFKYNMTDLQAALGIHQLRRLRPNQKRRKSIWSRYLDELRDVPIGLPAEPEHNTRHSYHLFPIMIDSRSSVARDDFLDAMTHMGIGVGVHYLSAAEHPVYQERFGWRPEAWPAAHRVGRETVSLPLSPKLTDGEVEKVIQAVRAAFGLT